MRRFRWPAAVAAAGVFVFLPGCLTLFSKTDVVRPDETRRPIRFESVEAAETFNKVVKEQNGSLGGAYFGVPFVTVYHRDRKLSETAKFNDAVARCDTDQDGTITQQEADIFAKLCKCE